LHNFLSERDYTIADKAIETIIESFDLLEKMPMAGTQVLGVDNLRKLVIEFGNSGYVLYYEYFIEIEAVVIATIFHQRERFFRNI